MFLSLSCTLYYLLSLADLVLSSKNICIASFSTNSSSIPMTIEAIHLAPYILLLKLFLWVYLWEAFHPSWKLIWEEELCCFLNFWSCSHCFRYSSLRVFVFSIADFYGKSDRLMFWASSPLYLRYIIFLNFHRPVDCRTDCARICLLLQNVVLLADKIDQRFAFAHWKWKLPFRVFLVHRDSCLALKLPIMMHRPLIRFFTLP